MGSAGIFERPELTGHPRTKRMNFSTMKRIRPLLCGRVIQGISPVRSRLILPSLSYHPSQPTAFLELRPCSPRKRLHVHTIIRKWITLPLSILLVSGQCQAATATAANSPKPADNSSNAIPLQAISTVGSCVTVEAVLLPKEPAAKQFGGWVADHYAVVKTTVSNHCDDKQFILHNIYFDYRDWALSGVYQGLIPSAACPSNASAASSSSTPPAPLPLRLRPPLRPQRRQAIAPRQRNTRGVPRPARWLLSVLWMFRTS